MSTAANGRAAVERYLAAAEAGDTEAVRQVFAEDASCQLGGDLPISGRWNGRDAIVDEFLTTALRYQPSAQPSGAVVAPRRVRRLHVASPPVRLAIRPGPAAVSHRFTPSNLCRNACIAAAEERRMGSSGAPSLYRR